MGWTAFTTIACSDVALWSRDLVKAFVSVEFSSTNSSSTTDEATDYCALSWAHGLAKVGLYYSESSPPRFQTGKCCRSLQDQLLTIVTSVSSLNWSVRQVEREVIFFKLSESNVELKISLQ